MWVIDTVHTRMHIHISGVCMRVCSCSQRIYSFVVLCCAVAEDWLAGRQAVSRLHVLARPELRSGMSVKAGVETEP